MEVVLETIQIATALPMTHWQVMKQVVGKPQLRQEWEIERVFRENGPFFHVHTEPLKTGVIFMSDEERAWYLAKMVRVNPHNVRQILSEAIWL